MCCVAAPSYTPGLGCEHIQGALPPKELTFSLGARKLGTLLREPKQVPGERTWQPGESGRLSGGKLLMRRQRHQDLRKNIPD